MVAISSYEHQTHNLVYDIKIIDFILVPYYGIVVISSEHVREWLFS